MHESQDVSCPNSPYAEHLDEELILLRATFETEQELGMGEDRLDFLRHLLGQLQGESNETSIFLIQWYRAYASCPSWTVYSTWHLLGHVQAHPDYTEARFEALMSKIPELFRQFVQQHERAMMQLWSVSTLQVFLTCCRFIRRRQEASMRRQFVAKAHQFQKACLDADA